MKAPPRATLPRIRIEETPANDLYLILRLLLPTPEVTDLLWRPGAFFQNHRAELRLATQLVENQLRQVSSFFLDDPAHAPEAHAGSDKPDLHSSLLR
ncbi:MAG: hypothetical protein HYY65_11880 [Candidatus Tectomicrobia bacterium]|uniref:Uncharacterized protein n=1 Tax=Tectimicrobiota bacterium TaxID=2528274 RepID=A0A932M1D7_UNCTE|nr:hypothetical protein [Candidatus Tectomicrobia bacterium]